MLNSQARSARHEAGPSTNSALVCDKEVCMFFTRSIRRKMALLLALVSVMLIVSSVAGLASLQWYYNAFRQLDFAVNQMPRRSDLGAAAGKLFEPLQAPLPPAARQREFAKDLQLFRDEVEEFFRRLDELSVTESEIVTSQRPLSRNRLLAVLQTVDEIDRTQTGLASQNLAVHRQTVAQLHRLVGKLMTQIHKIPDPQSGLAETIHNANEAYDTRLSWIVSSGVIVFLMFVGFMCYGYIVIFAPLRKLHRGARRVAQGDFDYRVRLKRVNTNDEIHELADAFNRMTDRFQEITANLDEQVHQRSQQLVRSERLAGIGFLAAGVAHEINNPLSAISMAAESLSDRAAELLAGAPEDDKKIVRQYLGMIERESFRCQQITRRLLDFARGQDQQRAEFDLTGTIIEVLEMVEHMSKYRGRDISLQHNGPVRLEGNGPEIKQVILNLVANAMEAMDDSGTLAIGLTEQTDAVVITFRDDGAGMTPEVIDHLFEPFFTRRKGGRGTGLGLSISHRIVTDHGGTIEATSDGPGTGTTFCIRLPRRSAAKLAA